MAARTCEFRFGNFRTSFARHRPRPGEARYAVPMHRNSRKWATTCLMECNKPLFSRGFRIKEWAIQDSKTPLFQAGKPHSAAVEQQNTQHSPTSTGDTWGNLSAECDPTLRELVGVWSQLSPDGRLSVLSHIRALVAVSPRQTAENGPVTASAR